MSRSRRDRSRPRDAGFILTETLATFVVSAFVLVALASIAPVLTRAMDRGVANIQDVETLSRTLEALRRDISGLSRARWNGDEPRSFVFRGGPNSLYFAHRAVDAHGDPEIQVVALREILAEGGTRLVRSEARLPVDATAFGDLHFRNERVLETGPARLRFWYVAVRKGPGEPARLHDWPSGPRLPAAVILEAIDAATTNLIVTARAPIRANADIGCLVVRAAPLPPARVDPANPQLNSGPSFDAASWLAGAQGVQGPAASPSPAPAGGVPDASITGVTDTTAGIFCGRDDTRKANGAAPAPVAAKSP